MPVDRNLPAGAPNGHPGGGGRTRSRPPPTEDFLGAGGPTTALLAGLSTAPPGRRVVLATLRTEAYRRFDAREESRLTGSDRDAWRTQRDVLRRAEVVRLARHWSPEERRRAADHRQDPRVNAALRAGERFGTAEVLSAGTELPTAWQNAWAPGANPRGAAVVAAAVDCSRAGLHRPVSRERLCELQVPYLTARGGGDLRPEPFAEAMDRACAAAYATSGLLVGDHSQGVRGLRDHLWRTPVTRVTPAEAYDMGLLAHQEGRSRRAAEALSRARRGGVAGADFLLAITLGDAGRLRRAAAELAGITRRRENRLGPRHPGTLAARAGRTAGAPAAWESLAADRSRVMGPDHPHTVYARVERARSLNAAGRSGEARALLVRTLREAEPLLEADHRNLRLARDLLATLSTAGPGHA
ncbi:hypothetical protein ACFV2Q_00155 [Streptomyces sp. NPDC059650]|uniref:hypothetical protein n=1 Tax=Streptomyces sp. NPDC059650 TaxID=3346896 RepID=UPI0036C1FDBD